MNDVELDTLVRQAAFAFLDELSLTGDGVLNRGDLARGFTFQGTRVPIVGPQGIFKPAVLPEIPLSITTVAIEEGKPRPYEDSVGADRLIRYRYRGADPSHHENRGLRKAMSLSIPVVYLRGLVPGKYSGAWPAFIVGDDPGNLTFTVAIDDQVPMLSTVPPGMMENELGGRRRYITTAAVQRLHQQDFRERVLRAYRVSCAICRLKHSRLLDAAHILPDGHPRGEPWVSNGLSLCKIHHAAFDANMIGITPSLVIKIRNDILKEADGPMLQL